MDLPEDLAAIVAQLDAAEGDAARLVAGLDDAAGAWRPRPGAWSVAECLDHLAVINPVYLAPMRVALRAARERGALRRGPARPGLFGGLFARQMEPPVRQRVPAPGGVRPAGRPLGQAWPAFRRSQGEVRALLRESADLDLEVRFANPFLPGVRFRCQAAFLIVAAHGRRHLWQAWNVRRSAGFPASG